MTKHNTTGVARAAIALAPDRKAHIMKRRWAWATGALLVAGLALAAGPAFAEPKQDPDVDRRVFSDFIISSLCREGAPDMVSNFSCTMPDGSVWTCIPAAGGHGGNWECVRESAAGPTDTGRIPEFPGPTEATQAPPPPAPPTGPVVTLPGTAPVQTR